MALHLKGISHLDRDWGGNRDFCLRHSQRIKTRSKHEDSHARALQMDLGCSMHMKNQLTLEISHIFTVSKLANEHRGKRNHQGGKDSQT